MANYGLCLSKEEEEMQTIIAVSIIMAALFGGAMSAGYIVTRIIEKVLGGRE